MTPLQKVNIVGGGLAGLSLGIALRKAGVPTDIFEAGGYPRHRVCGEFVTGLDDAIIQKLSIESAFAGAGRHRTVSWFLRDRFLVRQTLPSPARAVSRFVLDARLAAMFVAEGGKLITHTRTRLPLLRTGWVETSGRKPGSSSPWLGLKVHARDLKTNDDLEFHLGDGAYVGLSSVEDGWTNACGLFRRRPELRFVRDQALLSYLRASGLQPLAERIAAAHIQAGSTSTVAGVAFTHRIPVDDGVRLGDACAMIPPFTGNGMAMAFTGAALALDPLLAWARAERSWDETARCIRSALRKEFRLRLCSAALLHPFLINNTLQRCLGAAAHAGLLPLTSLFHLLH